MTDEHALELTRNLLRGITIPPQPTLLLEINEEKYQAEPDLSRIANLVSRDVALSASVLKTVNSSFFRLPEKIVSITHAVSILGLEAVFNIVTAHMMRQTFDDYGAPDEIHGFWDKAFNVARLGTYISERVGNVPKDEMYLLGLFHDCAIPLMAGHFDDYLDNLKMKQPQESRTEMEERLYHTNHAVVGYLIGRQWYLPEHLREAVLDHHSVEHVLRPYSVRGASHEPYLANLKLAEHANNRFYGNDDPEWGGIKAYVLDYLTLSLPDYDELIADIQELLLDPYT